MRLASFERSNAAATNSPKGAFIVPLEIGSRRRAFSSAPIGAVRDRDWRGGWRLSLRRPPGRHRPQRGRVSSRYSTSTWLPPAAGRQAPAQSGVPARRPTSGRKCCRGMLRSANRSTDHARATRVRPMPRSSPGTLDHRGTLLVGLRATGRDEKPNSGITFASARGFPLGRRRGCSTARNGTMAGCARTAPSTS